MGWKVLKVLRARVKGRKRNIAYTSSSSNPFYVLQTLPVLPPSHNLSHDVVVICLHICVLHYNCKCHENQRGGARLGDAAHQAPGNVVLHVLHAGLRQYVSLSVLVKKQNTLSGLSASFLPLVIWKDRRVNSCEKTETESGPN